MKRKILTPRERLFKECESLWSECIKARAGYKSEISCKTGSLHSHHLAGKPNYLLRFSLENGMALTAGEHKFIAHHAGRQKGFEERVKNLRGRDVYDRLETMKGFRTKTDLVMVKIYLTKKLHEYKEILKSYE